MKEEPITTEDILKEFPMATVRQVELILTWIENAYSEGYDNGAKNAL